MTKRRAPLTFADAVTRVAGLIGWDGCAAACGKSDRAVRNWSDPDTGTCPSIEDALRLDAAFLAAGGAEPPLMAVYEMRLQAQAGAAAPRVAALRQVARQTALEAGEFTASLIDAVEPGAPRAVIERAERQGLDLIADAARTVQALDRLGREGGGG